MANKKFWLGMLVMALVFGITVAGCDNDTGGGGSNGGNGGDVIPARWAGAYIADDGWTFTILTTGAVFWSDMNFSNRPNGSASGARIVNGGTGSGPGVTAEWVYLAINGVNHGIIINFTPSVANSQSVVGMGIGGASAVLDLMEDFGGTLSPSPNISGFPGFPTAGEWFWASR